MATKTPSYLSRMGNALYLFLTMKSTQVERRAIVPHVIFLKTMREAPVRQTLVILEGNKTEEPTPEAMWPLLKEFQDVLIDNLSPELLPL